MHRRSFRSSWLSVVLTAVSVPALSDTEDQASLLTLAHAAVAGAARGDDHALGLLGVLLELPAPMDSGVLAVIESGDLLPWLAVQRSDGRGESRRQLDALSARIAARQGIATRHLATTVSLGEIVVEVTDDEPSWIEITYPGSNPAELLIETTGCTPDVVAFDAAVALPAAPLRGQARFSPELAVVPARGPVALRIQRGACETNQLSLRLSAAPGRVVLEQSKPGSSDRFPELSLDRLTIVSLDRRSAETFSVPTEAGYVYEVFSAPLVPRLDPALGHADADRPGKFRSIDDDGGWQLGARLTPVIGTGRVERFALIRNDAARGEVAVLVRRHRVPEFLPTNQERVESPPSGGSWRRVTLSAGTWSIATIDLTPGFDPVLTVFDAVTGVALAFNDDFDEGSPAAQIVLQMDGAREILLQVSSLAVDGACTIAVTPAKSPASDHRPMLKAPPISAKAGNLASPDARESSPWTAGRYLLPGRS